MRRFVIFTLLLLSIALHHQLAFSSGPTCPTGGCSPCEGGICPSDCEGPCKCLTPYILNNNGVLDDDEYPLTEESAKFESKEVSAETAVLDGEQTEVVTVVNEYEKDALEIFKYEFDRLSPAEQWLVENLMSLSRTPAGQPVSADHVIPLYKDNIPIIDGLIEAGRLTGPIRQSDPNGARNRPTNIYYKLTVGEKNCYYRPWYQHDSTQGYKRVSQCSSNQNCYIQLHFCVSQNWHNNNTLEQITDFRRKPFYTDGLDFMVGMTPFLGTADMVVQSWDDLKNFDSKAWGHFCGSAAGDIFALGKLSKLYKGASEVGKAWQVASFVSGCGSVGLTGHHLYTEYSNGNFKAENWGEAAFLGIEIIALLTDRTSQKIIANWVKKKVITQKLPKSMCDCMGKCSPKIKAKIQVARESLSELASRFSRYCKTCWSQFSGFSPTWFTHTTGEIMDAVKQYPWRRLEGGGHRMEGVKKWLDELLGTESGGRKKLLEHLEIPHNQRDGITSYDSLWSWCTDPSRNTSKKCGVHPNGVKFIEYPGPEVLHNSNYKSTVRLSDLVSEGKISHPSLQSYPPGGKTQFPSDGTWGEDKLKKAATYILSSTWRHEVLSCKNQFRQVIGEYGGVKIVIFLQDNKVTSMFPAWKQ